VHVLLPLVPLATTPLRLLLPPLATTPLRLLLLLLAVSSRVTPRITRPLRRARGGGSTSPQTRCPGCRDSR
jgi:hypothetical protein